jgi:hypothetical protein
MLAGKRVFPFVAEKVILPGPMTLGERSKDRLQLGGSLPAQCATSSSKASHIISMMQETLMQDMRLDEELFAAFNDNDNHCK